LTKRSLNKTKQSLKQEILKYKKQKALNFECYFYAIFENKSRLFKLAKKKPTTINES